jgi:hypothetical protein
MASSFAVTHEQRPAAWIEIDLAERERFLDAQTGTPQDHDQASQPVAVRPSPAPRITAMISSTWGGSAG